MAIRNKILAGLVVLILHLVGAAGMLLPEWVGLMRSLTPVNLLIVAALVVNFQTGKTSRFYFYAAGCFIAAFAVEAVGVHTGWPFGAYTYGATLGPKWLGVPILIGANWVVLVLVTGSLVRTIDNPWLASLAGATLMTGIDLLLEPVAIGNDYWTWAAGEVPWQNYLSWAVVAFVFHLGLHFFKIPRRNDVDIYVVSAQVCFFTLLNWLS